MQRSHPLRVYTAVWLAAPDAAIQVLGIFAHYDEINVGRSFACQRRLDAGQQLDRPQIDVLVQLEAKLQQQPLFQYARWYIGMPYGPQ
jgi:hypothetical protein